MPGLNNEWNKSAENAANHEITQDYHESGGEQNLVEICENLVVSWEELTKTKNNTKWPKC